jgi:sphingomyelin phosphodiesterase acid-like 3
MVFRRLIAALLSGLCLLSAGVVCAAPAAAPTTKWLVLSDIHFNPFDDPALVETLAQSPPEQWHDLLKRSTALPSPYGKDTNYALLASSLAQMHAAIPNPPVVVIAGDFLAHDFSQFFAQAQPGKPPAAFAAFVDKTIAYLALEFNAAYPGAQFVITLGNNDGYCGDYASTPESPFLAHMVQAWAPLVNRNGRAPDFSETFWHAGYYVASLPLRAPSQAVIVNSVYWSTKYTNMCGLPNTNPGATEMDWLRATVNAPFVGNRVFLTHIAPGMDPYASMKSGKPVSLLHDAETQQLIDILAGANAHASALIAGHTHHPSFEIVGQSSGAPVPMMVVPSISPVQANNPAFSVVDVSADTGAIADFTTYALHLPLLGAPAPATWSREYAFDAAFGLNAFDATNLATLQMYLAGDPVKRASYVAYYNSQSPVGSIDAAGWPWYWCSDVNLTTQTYAACIAQTTPALSAH